MSDQTDRPQESPREQKNFIKAYADLVKDTAAAAGLSVLAFTGLPVALSTSLNMPKRVRIKDLRIDTGENSGDNPWEYPWQTLLYRINDETGGGRAFIFDPINRQCLASSIPNFIFGPTPEHSGEIVFMLVWLPVTLPIVALSNAMHAPRDRSSGMSRHARNFLRCLKGQVDEPTLAIIEDCLRHPVDDEECRLRPRPSPSGAPRPTFR